MRFTRKQMYPETLNVFDYECDNCKERIGKWELREHKCTSLEGE